MDRLKSQGNFEYLLLVLSILFLVVATSLISFNNEKYVGKSIQVGEITKFLNSSIPQDQIKATVTPTPTPSPGPVNPVCNVAANCYWTGSPTSNSFGWDAQMYCNGVQVPGSFVSVGCTGGTCACTGGCAGSVNSVLGSAAGSVYGTDFPLTVNLNNGSADFQTIVNCAYPVQNVDQSCPAPNFTVSPYCSPSKQTYMQIHFTTDTYARYEIHVFDNSGTDKQGQELDSDVKSWSQSSVFDSKVFGVPTALPDSIFYTVKVCNSCGVCTEDNRTLSDRTCTLTAVETPALTTPECTPSNGWKICFDRLATDDANGNVGVYNGATLIGNYSVSSYGKNGGWCVTIPKSAPLVEGITYSLSGTGSDLAQGIPFTIAPKDFTYDCPLRDCLKTMPSNGFTKAGQVNDCYICNYNASSFIFEDTNYTMLSQKSAAGVYNSSCDAYSNKTCETGLVNGSRRIPFSSSYLPGASFGFNYPFPEYGGTFNYVYDDDVGNYMDYYYRPVSSSDNGLQYPENFFLNYLNGARPTITNKASNQWTRLGEPETASKLFFNTSCTRRPPAGGVQNWATCLCNVNDVNCVNNVLGATGQQFDSCSTAGDVGCNVSWGVNFVYNSSNRNMKNNTKPKVLLEIPASFNSVSAGASGSTLCQGQTITQVAGEAAWCLDGSVIVAYDSWNQTGKTNFTFYFTPITSTTGVPQYLGYATFNGNYLTNATGWQSVSAVGGYFYCSGNRKSPGMLLKIAGITVRPAFGSGLDYAIPAPPTPSQDCSPTSGSGVIKLTYAGNDLFLFPGKDHLKEPESAFSSNLIPATGITKFTSGDGSNIYFNGIRYGWSVARHDGITYPNGVINGLDDAKGYLDDLIIIQYGDGTTGSANVGVNGSKLTRSLWTFDDTSYDSATSRVFANFVNENLHTKPWPGDTVGTYSFDYPGTSGYGTTADESNPISSVKNNSIINGFIRGLNAGTSGAWNPASVETGDSVCAAILNPNTYGVYNNPQWINFIDSTRLFNNYCNGLAPGYVGFQGTSSLVIQPTRQYTAEVRADPAYLNNAYVSSITGAPINYSTTNYQVTATNTIRSIGTVNPAPFLSFYDISNRFSYANLGSGIISLKYNDPSGVAMDLYNDNKIIFDSVYSGKDDYSNNQTYDQYTYHFEKSYQGSLGPSTEQDIYLHSDRLNLVSFYTFMGTSGRAGDGAYNLKVAYTNCSAATNIYTWEPDGTDPTTTNWNLLGATSITNPATNGGTATIPPTKSPDNGYSDSTGLTFANATHASGWNKVSSSFVSGGINKQIKPLRGYLIKPPVDCELIVTGRIVTEWTNRHLNSGWNLVGSPSFLSSLYDMNCPFTAVKSSPSVTCPASDYNNCLANNRDPSKTGAWNTATDLEPSNAYFVNLPKDCNFHFTNNNEGKYKTPDDVYTQKSYTVTLSNYTTTQNGKTTWNPFSIPYWELNVVKKQASDQTQYGSSFKNMIYGQPYVLITTNCTNNSNSFSIFSYNGTTPSGSITKDWIRYFANGTSTYQVSGVELRPGLSYIANASAKCWVTFAGSIGAESFNAQLSGGGGGTISGSTFTDSNPTSGCAGATVKQMNWDGTSWVDTTATSTQSGGGYFASDASDCDYSSQYNTDYSVAIWVSGNYKGKYPVKANSSTTWLRYGSLSGGTDTLDSQLRVSDGFRMCAGSINYTAPRLRVLYNISVGSSGSYFSIPTYDIDKNGNPIINSNDFEASNCLLLQQSTYYKTGQTDSSKPDFSTYYYSTETALGVVHSGQTLLDNYGFYYKNPTTGTVFADVDEYANGAVSYGKTTLPGFMKTGIKRYNWYADTNVPVDNANARANQDQTRVDEINFRPLGAGGISPGNAAINYNTKWKTLTNLPFGDLIDGANSFFGLSFCGSRCGPALTDWSLKKYSGYGITGWACVSDTYSDCNAAISAASGKTLKNVKDGHGGSIVPGGDWYPKSGSKKTSDVWSIIKSLDEMQKPQQGYFAIPYNKSKGNCLITGSGLYPSNDFDGPSISTTTRVLISPGIFQILANTIWVPASCTMTLTDENGGNVALTSTLYPGKAYLASFSGGGCTGKLKFPNRGFNGAIAVDSTSP